MREKLYSRFQDLNPFNYPSDDPESRFRTVDYVTMVVTSVL